MRIFKDTEHESLITESELRKEWDITDIRTDDEFEDYILDCTSKNGFLEQLDTEVEKGLNKYYDVENRVITTKTTDYNVTALFNHEEQFTERNILDFLRDVELVGVENGMYKAFKINEYDDVLVLVKQEWSEHGNPKLWENDTFICRIGE